MTWLKTGETYGYEGTWPNGKNIHLWDDIEWIGDTLNHEFHTAEMWPELSPKTIEDANRPWRAITNHRRAIMATLDRSWIDMWDAYELAFTRMALVLKVREYPNQSVSIQTGVWQMGSVPNE